MSNKIKVKVENLNLYYGENHALKDVNMDIQENAVTAFIGPSGCGKSTFLKTLNRMNDLVDGVRIEGKVLLDGEDIYDPAVDTTILRKKVGMVFQSFNLFNNMTVLKNCMIGQTKVLGKSKAEAKKAALHYLGKVGMAPYINAKPSQLSGGQKQRLCIARALLKKPKILILDDSTSAVDTATDAKIRQAFATEIPDTTKIIIAQRISSVQNADRIIVMDQGKIVMDGKPKEIFSRVDEMKTLGLEVPYATELAWELKKEGVNLSDTITTKEELVEELCQFV